VLLDVDETVVMCINIRLTIKLNSSKLNYVYTAAERASLYNLGIAHLNNTQS